MFCPKKFQKFHFNLIQIWCFLHLECEKLGGVFVMVPLQLSCVVEGKINKPHLQKHAVLTFFLLQVFSKQVSRKSGCGVRHVVWVRAAPSVDFCLHICSRALGLNHHVSFASLSKRR